MTEIAQLLQAVSTIVYNTQKQLQPGVVLFPWDPLFDPASYEPVPVEVVDDMRDRMIQYSAFSE